MSPPVNLADLPTASPLLLGRAQCKSGVVGGATNYNNTVAARPLTDTPGIGAGSAMQIAVTPQYDCWWRVTAKTIWSTPDAIWSRADWGIDLSPADMDGYYRTVALQDMHSATGWMHCRCTALYRLRGGTAYTATMMWIASPSGYNQQHYCSQTYHYIMGHTFAEGRI